MWTIANYVRLNVSCVLVLMMNSWLCKILLFVYWNGKNKSFFFEGDDSEWSERYKNQ